MREMARQRRPQQGLDAFLRGAVLHAALSLVGCTATLGGPLSDAGTDAGGSGTCELIQCGPSQRCIAGACMRDDPCAGIECREEGTVCSHGSCVSAALDEDRDGSPAADDCDDQDPHIFAGSVVDCQTACGEGTTTCLSGTWSACTAPLECECRPGDTRDEPCGNCGFARRTCSDAGTWGGATGCAGEGPCSPGSSEVEPCPQGGGCSQRRRSCAADCSWNDWGGCLGQDECTPGDVSSEACGNCGARDRTCNDACLWNAFGACAEGTCAPGDVQTQACGNCGTQSRTCDAGCNWGAWGACGGQGACAPGDVQGQSCGACQTQERTCQANCSWGAWGACSGQSACVPGDVETQACGNCGSRSHTCQADCTWGAWSACGGEGACAPGQVLQQACDVCGTQTQTCTAGCAWPGYGACQGGCPGWTCTPFWFGTDDGCDCGCGAQDPDCFGIGCLPADCCAAGACQGCDYCWPSTGFCA